MMPSCLVCCKYVCAAGKGHSFNPPSLPPQVQESVSEFIMTVSNEAADRALADGRRVLTPDDLVVAATALGWGSLFAGIRAEDPVLAGGLAAGSGEEKIE